MNPAVPVLLLVALVANAVLGVGAQLLGGPTPPLPAVAPQTREEMDSGLPRGGERAERRLDREGRVLHDRELPANRQPGAADTQKPVKKPE